MTGFSTPPEGEIMSMSQVEIVLKREIEAGFRVIEQYGYKDNRVISIDLVMSAPRARGRKDLCGFFEFGQASQPYPMPPTGPHWAGF